MKQLKEKETNDISSSHSQSQQSHTANLVFTKEDYLDIIYVICKAKSNTKAE